MLLDRGKNADRPILPMTFQSTSETPSVLTKRRHVLSTIGLGTLGILASSTKASAGILGFGNSVRPAVMQNFSYAGLPEEWVARQGALLPAYVRYLQRVNLRYMTVQQVIDAHAKSHGSVWNNLPPQRLWPLAVPTLRAVDRVAMSLNQPVQEIISVYRCPVYNARCPGAKSGSWHQANVAMDVRFSTRASLVANTARDLRSRGLFKGGVGHYSDFTHIDTRGQNIDWSA
jgi:Peptidase M15